MKAWKSLSLALAFLGSSSLMAQSLNVLHVKEDISTIGFKSALWEKAKMGSVEAYPQTTIEMNDATLMKENANNKAKKIGVKVVQSGEYVALLLQWSDKTKNVQQGLTSNVYGDGFAVQFSTVSDKLPYIGMGSDGRAVIVHLQKATGKTYEPNNSGDVYHQVNGGNQNAFAKEFTTYKDEVSAQGSGDYQRVFIAEGFRSTTQIRDNSEPAVMEMKHENGQWSGLLVRKLKSEHLDLTKDSFPVAFAIWDGGKKNRDGSKLLTPWVGVGAKALVALDELKGGDVANGEKVMMENCSACHQYKEVKSAPNYMAPELSNIGGYANASYLLESIVEPSAVVVPGYNTTAHPNFQWYTVEKGVRTSTMPSFSHLDEKSLKDLVVYLKTLKVGVEK
jgi:complex iron-sulfur molybdoenzyme family reductase subunit gamma